jgi:putative addiction module component (TIGR02574 family)
MASGAVQHVIALASQLVRNERNVVVDAIAPKESVEELAAHWEAEIERRAERVLSSGGTGAPAEEVFARIAAKLLKR